MTITITPDFYKKSYTNDNFTGKPTVSPARYSRYSQDRTRPDSEALEIS